MEYSNITNDKYLKLLEGLNLNELEICILHYEGIFGELIYGNYMPVTKEEKQKYTKTLFSLSYVLVDLKNIRDKKYNELSISEKKEHLRNSFEIQISQYISGRLGK